MHNKMVDLQKQLNENNISRFILHSYENYTLKIIGSFDFDYSYEVEITFYGVSFVSCETYFSNARIRLATDQDKEDLLLVKTRGYSRPVYKGPDSFIGRKMSNVIICIPISEELYNEECFKYFIIARDFEYKFEQIVYKGE